jgi:hypothetical protein
MPKSIYFRAFCAFYCVDINKKGEQSSRTAPLAPYII